MLVIYKMFGIGLVIDIEIVFFYRIIKEKTILEIQCY
jgi:hypothetical protein